MKKVVITGIGAVTPLGNTFNASWDSLCAGRSGIRAITKFDASCLPWNVAGELTGFEGETYLSRKDLIRLDPFVHYAVAAAVMAAKDAGLKNSPEATSRKADARTREASGSSIPHYLDLASAGVIVGSSRGGISTLENALLRSQQAPLSPQHVRLSPYLMPSTTVSMAASTVAQGLGLRGECLGISNACSSGTNAIGEAFRLVRHGLSPLLIAGGTDAPICRLSVEGYGRSGALSKNAPLSGNNPDVPRPFDRRRDGFVLSEGAAVVVVEEYEHAMKRDARIYGEIAAYGNTTDSFHMTKPDPEGEARSIASAMREAGIGPDEIDYINTHGTATLLGDVAEAKAIQIIFGKRASEIPASALKCMTGHMLAASGAFEIACTLMSLKEGLIPPTINLDEKDPACDINVLTARKEADIKIALSNSFGFGGVNAVVVLKRWP